MTPVKTWMKEVDQAVIAISGLSVHDLADYNFRDAWEAGESPEEVADAMLEDEGFLR